MSTLLSPQRCSNSSTPNFVRLATLVAEFVQFMVNMRKEDQEAAEESKRLELKEHGEGGDGDSEDGTTADTSISPVSNGLLPAPPGGKTAKSLQVSALTPIKTAATVGAEQNFGLPVLQSPTNENWLEMSLDMGRSRRKLPKLGGSAKIAP